MSKDSVQAVRGPRNSTLQRQSMEHNTLIQDMTQNLKNEMMFQTSMYCPTILPPMYIDMSMQQLSPPGAAFMCPTTYLANPYPSPPLHHYHHQTTGGVALDFEGLANRSATLVVQNIRWVKEQCRSLPDLPICDQLIILEDSWKEFFIIGVAQHFGDLNLGHLLYNAEPQTYTPNLVYRSNIIASMQNVLQHFAIRNIDSYEYDCLRAIVLFRADNNDGDFNRSGSSGGSPSSSVIDYRSLSQVAHIQSLQDDAKRKLEQHTLDMAPAQRDRFEHLMQILPHMSSVTAETIDDLFFSKKMDAMGIVVAIKSIFLKNDC